MPPVFTHNYKLKIGGKTLEGKAEFNVDGEASFEPTSIPPVLTLAEVARVNSLFNEIKNVLNCFGGDIELVRFKKIT